MPPDSRGLAPAPPPGTNMDIWHQIGRALWDVVTGANNTKYGLGGVIHAAAVIFFAYLGFEAVSTAGAERAPKLIPVMLTTERGRKAWRRPWAAPSTLLTGSR